MKLLLFQIIFFSVSTYALECPKDDQSIPLCPTSGSTLLDDTYPVQSYVISDSGIIKDSKTSAAVPLDFISNIVDSYSENNYDRLPQMIFSTKNESDYMALKNQLSEKLKSKNIPESTITKILGQVTFRSAKSYTWQQDYFESFFNPITGKPVLRKVAGYDKKMHVNTGKLEDLTAAGQACGISTGEPLEEDPNSESISGEMGGNIDGAPGGFCLVGDNQGNDYTKSFCKSDDNIIQLNVSWLSVGHVDELFKIIPTNINDGRPKECQFSLMAASPNKALELMKSPKYGKENIFSSDDKVATENLDNYFLRKPSPKTEEMFCKTLKDIKEIKRSAPAAKPAESIRSVFMRTFSFLFPETLAEDKLVVKETPDSCELGVKNTSNYDYANGLSNNKDFMTLNNTIQDSIDSDKAKIKENILSRLPQCKAYYDKSVLDVPNIFMSSGGRPTEENPQTGKQELRKELGIVDSVYPNPSNSVVMNKTILFPDPENKAFSGYLSDEMKKRGMTYKSITTWDYAHLGDGNIHCSSHSLNHCRVK